MSERQVIESTAGELRFEFAWVDSSADVERLGPTYGELAVWLGGALVWGEVMAVAADGRGIPSQWIELLEYLGNNWLYLVLEQGYPFGASADAPSLLDHQLEDRWRYGAESRVAQEEGTAYAFKMSHNLAEASSGTLRPDLWFVRDGGLFTVEARSATESIVERLRDYDVKGVLGAVGEAIAARLAGASDLRSKLAVERWSQRESQPLDVLARVATRLPTEYLRQTCGDEPFDAVFTDPLSSWVDDNAFVDLAYRCKGAMPPAALRTLLDAVRAAPVGVSSQLEAVTEGAVRQLTDVENTLRRPFQQGHALANWLRQDIGAVGARVDPDSLLASWNVSLGSHDFETRRLDAVAYWAHGRQPAVLWNTTDKHQANEGARRATLAHEICHLLVDRHNALPLSAVVGGAMERRLEQRANAFAAELLCPRREAGAEYRQWRNVAAALDSLTHRFGVSKELASLQIAQSDAVQDGNHQLELEEAGPPGAFYPWDRG